MQMDREAQLEVMASRFPNNRDPNVMSVSAQKITRGFIEKLKTHVLVRRLSVKYIEVLCFCLFI